MELILLIIFILMSATFSGLTIGMFSLSLSGLERKIRLGDVRAERVYSIRKNGNFLLCTLLLGNVSVNTGIALVMAEISAGVWAGVISTILIFVFGEVMPQAIFSRFALSVGYHTAWLVKIFMFLMYPVAKPMSMLLNFMLGKEFPELFNRRELSELIADHDGGTIDQDERRIMMGAMRFSEKTARDVLTPANIMFYLYEDDKLDMDMLISIKNEHYSRIPICNGSRDNVVGILFAKDLIGIDSNDDCESTAGEVCRRENLLSVKQTMHLDSLMNHFLRSKTHMAFVHDEYGVLRGIVTLEDIMEEVLGIEIMDEADTVADLQHQAKNDNHVKMTE